jgi:hypothetical protein
MARLLLNADDDERRRVVRREMLLNAGNEEGLGEGTQKFSVDVES